MYTFFLAGIMMCLVASGYAENENRLLSLLSDDEKAQVVTRIDQIINQLSVVEIVAQVRTAYFIPASNAEKTTQLLVAVKKNLALLCEEYDNPEVAQVIMHIGSDIGSVGSDLQNGSDKAMLLARIEAAFNTCVSTQNTIITLAAPFYCVLQREVYHDLAAALRMIPEARL